MSKPAVRTLALVLLLAAAALAAAWVQGQWSGYESQDGPGTALVADLDTWRATPRERWVQAAFDLRLGADWEQVPFQVGDWVGEDVPQDNLEVYLLLQPEQYLFRQYRRADGASLWLSVLGGREARSFHPPQICYTADGWRTEMRSEAIPLAGGELWAMHLLARKGDAWHSVLYFYLWPDRERRPQGGTVLFKVTAPLKTGDAEEVKAALAEQKDFVREFFSQP
ncbi:MAG: exosortase C-terminal domain/associated protein EpsI [Anaerolineae bacterium]